MDILLRPMSEPSKSYHIELSMLIDATSLQVVVILPLFLLQHKNVSVLNMRGRIEVTYKHFPGI